MKKVLAILLSTLLLFTALPLGAVSVSAATSGTTGSCTWTLNGTVLTISGNGAMKDYAETHQVSDTLISTSLYPTPWGKDITSVTIEDGVTTIGGGAFYGCSKLTSVTIGNNVTSIGQYAFGSCTSLTTVSFPNSVITIERYAFDSCRSLKRVTIGNGVTTIHSRAFEYCRSLTAISVDENNPNYSSLDGVLFNKEQTALIWFPRTKSGAYTIPDSVTTIGDYAFESCTSLTAVTIPDSVITIGARAFECCTSLTAVDIPDSVITIGAWAFECCTSLTAVTIPDGVTTIGSRAFADCESLTAISVDENNPNYSSVDGVLFDKDQTTLIKFPDCSGKTEYTIPDSVTTIGGSAFENCFGLFSVTIGNGVTTIGDSAFVDCYNLTNVYYTGTEEDRANIEIGYWNEEFLNATWHYGYDGHVYDDCWDRDCNKCGEVRDVPDHIFDILWTMEPTCGMEGYAEYFCVFCGYWYAESTPATGDHVYYNDCDSDCNVCGEERWVPDHWYELRCETTPTCGMEGYAEYFCVFCGFCYGEIIPATGDHVYDDEYDADCNACGEFREVPEKPILYGDANGDGAVNARDAALLQQYVAGWDVTLVEASADANGDGAVNARDAALLQQYVAGWDVT